MGQIACSRCAWATGCISSCCSLGRTDALVEKAGWRDCAQSYVIHSQKTWMLRIIWWVIQINRQSSDVPSGTYKACFKYLHTKAVVSNIPGECMGWICLLSLRLREAENQVSMRVIWQGRPPEVTTTSLFRIPQEWDIHTTNVLEKLVRYFEEGYKDSAKFLFVNKRCLFLKGDLGTNGLFFFLFGHSAQLSAS